MKKQEMAEMGLKALLSQAADAEAKLTRIIDFLESEAGYTREYLLDEVHQMANMRISHLEILEEDHEHAERQQVINAADAGIYD